VWSITATVPTATIVESRAGATYRLAKLTNELVDEDMEHSSGVDIG
jgi:hypothetical protein